MAIDVTKINTASVLPIGNSLPFYIFQVDLSGVIYTLRIRYNGRTQRWTCDIADASNNDIINGLVLELGVLIAYRFALANLPSGQIVTINNDTTDQEQASRYSFGVTHQVLYLEVV